jgi:hypothetical protein
MNELELLSRYGQVEPMDSALIDATVQSIVQLPDPSVIARHRTPGPGRRRVARLVVVGASVAAAVAATVVLRGADGPSFPRPAPQAAQAPESVLTGYVVDHSLAALATAGGYIEGVVQQDSSGVRTSWRGPHQLLNEVPGQTATLWTWAAGVDTVLSVDYEHHTWSRSAIPAPPPPPAQGGGPPPPGAYVFSQKALNGPEPDVTSIATLFRQAGTRVIGGATIDGASAYELSIPALDQNGKPVIGKGITAWVNRSTYLPVRIALGPPAGPGPNNGAEAPTSAWTQDFTWEPATPQALAVFNLKPPALFHEIADPALQPVPPAH